MEQKTDKPAYFAVLPANVRYDKDLKLLSRLLYAEITSLCNKEGFCWASNKYFANLYQVSIQTISNCINQLKEKQYIKVEMVYKEGTKEILYRYIRIFEYPIKENFNTPIKENFKDNNTSINNKTNNKNNNIESNSLFELGQLPNKQEEQKKKQEEQETKFNIFWQAYPVKKDKKKAKDKFIRHLKNYEFNDIMKGLEKYKQYIIAKQLEEKYIKHPTTWLNGECWNDEYNTEQTNGVVYKEDGSISASSIGFKWSV